MSTVRLTSLVKTSGCAAKLPPRELHRIIDSLPVMASPNLAEGFETADDALVWRLDDRGNVCIQTVDFFPPMVDDPYTFGQIAAANALSDVYAMGGEPSIALNLVCFPACIEIDEMRNILLGGLDKAKEAGAVIAGGHTISDPTPKYGLCVTAFMKESDVWSNKGARPGDAVVLTKALGVGIVNTAAKVDEADPESVKQAVDSMTRLNKHARDVARKYNVHGATDVTGFSLSGHGSEVASASGVTLRINTADLPVITGALELARFGFLPEGRYANEDFLVEKVCFADGISREMRDLCYDPQTSGGLLLFMSEEDAKKYVAEMNTDCCRIIGKVCPQGKFLMEYVRCTSSSAVTNR